MYTSLPCGHKVAGHECPTLLCVHVQVLALSTHSGQIRVLHVTLCPCASHCRVDIEWPDMSVARYSMSMYRSLPCQHTVARYECCTLLYVHVQVLALSTHSGQIRVLHVTLCPCTGPCPVNTQWPDMSVARYSMSLCKSLPCRHRVARHEWRTSIYVHVQHVTLCPCTGLCPVNIIVTRHECYTLLDVHVQVLALSTQSS